MWPDRAHRRAIRYTQVIVNQGREAGEQGVDPGVPHERPEEAHRGELPELRRQHGVKVLIRADGTLLALFESPYNLNRLERDKPELTLDAIIATS